MWPAEAQLSSDFWLAVILIRNKIKLLEQAAFNLPLMLLTASHQEEHMIKVRSDTEKMLHKGGDVCTCLIHQRPSAISDEPVWSNNQSCCWSTACKSCTYMYHSAASGNQLSSLEAEHPLLPENVAATWGEEAQSESSALHRFCHKCLYVNDSMSDNL